MASPYTDDYLALMGTLEPADIIIETLEISHSNFTQTYYLSNYNKEFTGNIPAPTVFLPFGFVIVLPKQNEDGRGNARIIIDATDRTLIDELELAISTFNEPISCKYRPFIEGDPTPQIDFPFVFKLFNLSYENNQIIAEGNLPEFNNYPFPRNRYTIQNFPALEDI